MSAAAHWLVLLSLIFWSSAKDSSTDGYNRSSLPLKQHKIGRSLQKRGISAIGLGDDFDTIYSVEVQIGSNFYPLIFDTGSSDTLVLTDKCNAINCGVSRDVALVPSTDLNYTNLSVHFEFGGSAEVDGNIASASVAILNARVDKQFLGAIKETNLPFGQENLTGLVGAGFPAPVASPIELELIQALLPSNAQVADISNEFLDTIATNTPLFTRLILEGQFEQPMFTVTLERETFEIGGNIGQLTLGGLPDGVLNDSLTWVPVRLYTPQQGGIPSPSGIPNEIYPLRWEIPLDDVFINGQKLPHPSTAGTVGYSALVDSGTTAILGPQNVVNKIYNTIASSPEVDLTGSTPPEIPCNVPVSLTFVIGGKEFPLDPRDFFLQQSSTQSCTAGALQLLDDPSPTALMSWVLGATFMRSNLVAFYFGNLTHPSRDPPRIGFLSTVPANASLEFNSDVKKASASSGEFPGSIIMAPTGTFIATITNAVGVAQQPTPIISPNPISTSQASDKDDTNDSYPLTVPAYVKLHANFRIYLLNTFDTTVQRYPLFVLLPLNAMKKRQEKNPKNRGGRDFKLTRRENTAIGIGDAADSIYSSSFRVGTTLVDLQLDTGSSDLWAISTQCTSLSCPIHFNTSRISSPLFNRTKAAGQFSYGDAQNPTSASGPIVSGSVQLADFLVQNQFIVAANATNTPLASIGLSGVFGLGFPFGNASQIVNQLVQRMIPKNTSPNGVTDILLSILPLEAPMVPRLSLSGELDLPLFTISLQRTLDEFGGNVGLLTIGDLPGSLSQSSLTNVAVRLYSPDEGGIPGPSTNPSETYPLNWEVPLDAVLLNGQELPLPSDLPGMYTALIDSGSSSLAGPEDVISAIYSAIALSGSSNNNGVPQIDCNKPVNLTFVFGGESFPVDSRDFLGFQESSTVCKASTLQVASPPTEGRLFSWVLGTPFFKSNLIAFYYGDLMQPSVDPPRIGFLSTVPEDSNEAYASDIASASQAGQFFETTITAPTATFAVTAINSGGVGQAPTEGPAVTGASVPDSTPDFGNTDPGVSEKNNNGAFKSMTKLAHSKLIYLSMFLLFLWV